MPKLAPTLALGVALLAACSCSERILEERDSGPDIDGLCQVYCERTIECRWAPDRFDFDTVEGCVDNCRETPEWEMPRCAQTLEAMLTCTAQYECPTFADYGRGCYDDTTPDGLCCPEISANSSCF